MFKPNFDKQALEVLEQIGGIKKTTEERRSHKKTLLPSEKLAYVRDQVRTILRAVMRQPNKEVFSQLVFLHGKIKENFESMTDEAIRFLLKHSASEARGGFTPKVKKERKEIIKDAVQKFRDFLAQEPHTIKPQLLLTKIETILAAMGYLYSANLADTTEEQKMFDKVEELMKDKVAERIKITYPSRTTDLVLGKEPSVSDIVAEPQDVSSASEAEEEERYPPKPPSAKFFNKGSETNISWPEAAVENGIPIRAHVSASATLLMPAIDGLYDSGTNRSEWFKNDNNAKMLSGALLLPTLERGDYHTIAETTVGVNFYLNERARKKKDEHTIVNEPMTPDQAFKDGLSMLVNAASNERTTTQQMSLQRAISITAPSLIHLTDEIKAQSTLLKHKVIKF